MSPWTTRVTPPHARRRLVKATEAVRTNERLVLVCTEGGGHLGYQDPASLASDAEGRWIERVVAGFLGVVRDQQQADLPRGG